MKSFGQLSEDLETRRQQLKQQIILDQNILLRHESLLEVGAVQEMQVLALRSKLAKSEYVNRCIPSFCTDILYQSPLSK